MRKRNSPWVINWWWYASVRMVMLRNLVTGANGIFSYINLDMVTFFFIVRVSRCSINELHMRWEGARGLHQRFSRGHYILSGALKLSEIQDLVKGWSQDNSRLTDISRFLNEICRCFDGYLYSIVIQSLFCILSLSSRRRHSFVVRLVALLPTATIRWQNCWWFPFLNIAWKASWEHFEFVTQHPYHCQCTTKTNCWGNRLKHFDINAKAAPQTAYHHFRYRNVENWISKMSFLAPTPQTK